LLLVIVALAYCQDYEYIDNDPIIADGFATVSGMTSDDHGNIYALAYYPTETRAAMVPAGGVSSIPTLLHINTTTDTVTELSNLTTCVRT
jgi:hypothetical protein